MREFCCRVEFSTEFTEPSCTHTKEKSPNPIAEQMNVTLPSILAVILLGLIVTTGGDTTKEKVIFKFSVLTTYICISHFGNTHI